MLGRGGAKGPEKKSGVSLPIDGQSMANRAEASWNRFAGWSTIEMQLSPRRLFAPNAVTFLVP
jgi:hypothetical protein